MRYGKATHERMFVKDRVRQLTNCVFGLTGEAGEISDFYKKLWFHPTSPLTKTDLRKEIGDVLWYLATLNEIEFGDSLLNVAKENIAKLQERYPDRYSDVRLEELSL